MFSFKKYLYISVGSLALGVGIIGIFLPVIPTTPLFLLSCYCYSMGSTRFHHWLIHTSFYQKYTKDFIENRQLTLSRKVFLLSFASTMLLIPLFILDGILKLFIIGIYIYLYYYFIFKIKTIRQPMEDSQC